MNRDPYLDALVRALRIFVKQQQLKRVEEAEEEFDVWDFCEKIFLEGDVHCDEHGCWTTDDVLNGMCSDIWEEIADEMGLLDLEDSDEDWYDDY